MSPEPTTTAACCEVHRLGKCDAVFTCCDECPTFFSQPATAAPFVHGDFVRPRPAGNVHIVMVAHPRPAGTWYDMACGKSWWQSVLDPADGDHGRQCGACWEAM